MMIGTAALVITSTVVSKPSMPGMSASISTTSGLSMAIVRTTCRPLEASPTTAMSACADSRRRRSARIRALSSTTRTLIIATRPYISLRAVSRSVVWSKLPLVM